jgi:hypothetical protein
MAKLSVNVCDLCKRMTKEDLTNRIILGIAGKKPGILDREAGSVKHGDICKECHEDLVKRLDDSFVPTTLKLPQQGEAKLVPSANKTPIAKADVKELCSHEKRRFDDVRMVAVCRECGHEEKA